MMQFKKNAEVLTVDGETVGKVDRVVIDPSTHAVSHIVVNKGLLFSEDRVVPLDDIAITNEERILLQKDKQEWETLPRFEEKEFVPILSDSEAEDEKMPTEWAYYPPLGRPYAAPPHLHQFLTRTVDQNIPQGTVALQEGAAVEDNEGNRLGSVERVIINEPEDFASHIVISQGLVNKTKRLIPTTWVRTVQEDTVRLSMPETLIINLPEFKN